MKAIWEQTILSNRKSSLNIRYICAASNAGTQAHNKSYNLFIEIFSGHWDSGIP